MCWPYWIHFPTSPTVTATRQAQGGKILCSQGTGMAGLANGKGGQEECQEGRWKMRTLQAYSESYLEMQQKQGVLETLHSREGTTGLYVKFE